MALCASRVGSASDLPVAAIAQNSAAPIDAAAIRRLAAEIAGQVITPETPVYDTARQVFNRAFDRHPALIVRCAGASDVARPSPSSSNCTCQWPCAAAATVGPGLASATAGW